MFNVPDPISLSVQHQLHERAKSTQTRTNLYYLCYKYRLQWLHLGLFPRRGHRWQAVGIDTAHKSVELSFTGSAQRETRSSKEENWLRWGDWLRSLDTSIMPFSLNGASFIESNPFVKIPIHNSYQNSTLKYGCYRFVVT